MSSIRGAGWVGLRHGSVCVGCCAGLMVALTGAGVIDPAWIGVLALIVMLEKVHPQGQLLGRATGVALLLAAPFASYATTSAASARPAGLAALALVAVTALALGRVSRQPFPSEVR